MTHQLQVRPATVDDHQAVSRLYVQLKEHHRRLQPGNPRYGVTNDEWSEVALTALIDPDVYMYVAQLGAEIAGFMKITYAQKPWGVSCELETMVVDKHQRGKGVGGHMLQEAETLARKRGAKGMRVDVLIPNYEGREFYERHGYEAFAVRYGKPVHD
jgi:ribosomal protein S18 acetylase RimI-like enzyme